MEPVDFLSEKYFYYHAVFVFIMGTLVGSFLNVCIYRLPARKSIVFPNSYCYSCGSSIRWYDNIPLLSYIVLHGRCRDCGAHFSLRYFFIELLTGIIFVLSFWKLSYTWSTPIYIVFICYFIIATFTDLDHWIIPDSISLGGLCLSLLVAVVAPVFYPQLIITTAGPFSGFYWSSLLNALVGAGVGFALLYSIGVLGSLVFRKEAMGGGDVKLFAFIGALLGWTNVLIVLALSSFIGAMTGSLLVLVARLKHPPVRKLSNPALNSDMPELERLQKILNKIDTFYQNVRLSSPVPFGPSIAVATIIVILWQKEILLYLNYLWSGAYYK